MTGTGPVEADRYGNYWNKIKIDMPARPKPAVPIATSVEIQRYRDHGMGLVVVKAAPVSELHLTLTPINDEPPAQLARAFPSMI